MLRHKHQLRWLFFHEFDSPSTYWGHMLAASTDEEGTKLMQQNIWPQAHRRGEWQVRRPQYRYAIRNATVSLQNYFSERWSGSQRRIDVGRPLRMVLKERMAGLPAMFRWTSLKFLKVEGE